MEYIGHGLQLHTISRKPITTWHGTDASNIESLFHNGLLMRLNAKNKVYEIIYRNLEDEFFLDTWDAVEWRERLSKNEKDDCFNVADLADMCGMDAETYLDETSDENLLYDLLNCYGYDDVIGYYYTFTFTENEIRQRLNKALYK